MRLQELSGMSRNRTGQLSAKFSRIIMIILPPHCTLHRITSVVERMSLVEELSNCHFFIKYNFEGNI